MRLCDWFLWRYMHFENLKLLDSNYIVILSNVASYMKNRKTTSHLMYSIFDDQKEGKKKVFIKVLRLWALFKT